MISGLLAAVAVLAAASADGAAQSPAASAPPAAGAGAPHQLEGVTVKKTCRYVETTGARTRRRVCTDAANADEAAVGVTGIGSTINKSHQGNINMSPRR